MRVISPHDQQASEVPHDQQAGDFLHDQQAGEVPRKAIPETGRDSVMRDG